MEKDAFTFQMVVSMMVNGKTIKWMVMEHLLGLMVDVMMDMYFIKLNKSMLKIKKMVSEILLIQMDLCIKVIGWMVKSMVKVHFTLRMDYIEKGNGKTEKELNGHHHTNINDHRILNYIIHFIKIIPNFFIIRFN